MRDIAEVTDRIIAVIPESNHVVLNDLNKFRQGLGYKAPEQIGDSWARLSEMVNLALIDTTWKADMVSILTGTADEVGW